MKKWRPPDVLAEDEWNVNHQIVVPRVYRPEILNLAHETPMSGHLGVNKTYHKILNHFYWPGLKSDVSQFCKCCHTCQTVGKPNQIIRGSCKIICHWVRITSVLRFIKHFYYKPLKYCPFTETYFCNLFTQSQKADK